jgi:hypothetical protein
MRSTVGRFLRSVSLRKTWHALFVLYPADVEVDGSVNARLIEWEFDYARVAAWHSHESVNMTKNERVRAERAPAGSRVRRRLAHEHVHEDQGNAVTHRLEATLVLTDVDSA